MGRIKTPVAARRVRHRRIRRHLSGTTERPRLNVYRSGRDTYAPVGDLWPPDAEGFTPGPGNEGENGLAFWDSLLKEGGG